jgi:hypothetical protein
MRKNNAFRRAAALMAALSITVSLAAPAFADTYYIDYGDITITKNEDGSQTIEQGGEKWTDKAGEETVITTSNTVITTLESDLEGPAAEDSDFGPVVEDNYQPAQPEDAEKLEGADRPESTEEPKAADRQESADQQAAPAAAPADTTPVNKKDDGFWGNTITVINNFADKVLNLTLKDVKIDVSDTGGDNFEFEDDQRGKAALSVQGKGNVEIELDGDNELKSGTQSAGLEKTSTGTLTLKDDSKEAGSLTATGGNNAAGIGGGFQGNGENITITGGTVTATGGFSAAGIGGGREGKGENITITGGTVNATSNDGAGIGGGLLGSGENIAITGGTVNATGTDGAGIGGGNGGVSKNITITGGTVTAAGGFGNAGIGGGNGSDGENITITGGSVTATGGEFAAGIGGSNGGSGNNITITGGTVTATGGEGGAGIGGGAEGGGGNNITIKGGTVTATGGGNRGNSGAGIGGGSSGSGENITINDGKVTATGGNYAAGIGGGSVGRWGGDAGSGKNITINGGTVNATGGGGAAASDIEFWGSNGGNGEDITINGGTVNAAGAYGGAGIGGGLNGIGSKITVSGAAHVTATATASRDPDWPHTDTGATIGNGSTRTPDGKSADGKEIQADINGLTTGWIHHIIYNPLLNWNDEPDTILKEWWEFALPKPIPDGESLDLHVETLKGAPLPFNTRQQGSTLRVTTDNLSARLHGTRQALETLQEQGVEQIEFVTTLKTTTLSVEDLLAEGGSWFALEHDGLGSRRLSAAQAESLKCWRH